VQDGVVGGELERLEEPVLRVGELAAFQVGVAERGVDAGEILGVGEVRLAGLQPFVLLLGALQIPGTQVRLREQVVHPLVVGRGVAPPGEELDRLRPLPLLDETLRLGDGAGVVRGRRRPRRLLPEPLHRRHRIRRVGGIDMRVEVRLVVPERVPRPFQLRLADPRGGELRAPRPRPALGGDPLVQLDRPGVVALLLEGARRLLLFLRRLLDRRPDLRPLQQPLHDPGHRLRAGPSGREVEVAPVGDHGVGGPLQVRLVEDPEVVVAGGERRVELHGAPELVGGLVVEPHLAVADAELVVRLAETRVHPQRRLELGDRLLVVAALLVAERELVVARIPLPAAGEGGGEDARDDEANDPVHQISENRLRAPVRSPQRDSVHSSAGRGQ